MAVPVWTVLVDWGGVGTYIAAGDDISARTLDTSPVIMTYGRNQARALAPVAPGTMNFLIDNVSRDYSPDNTGSAIAPNVTPGRPVKTTALLNAVTYTMYLGFFDTYMVSAQDHTVAVSAVDALGRLGGSPASAGVVLSTALYQGVRTGAAVGLILDAVGWPGGLRDLDAGATQIRWWWEEGTDAFTALAKIIASEGPPAICYVDALTGNFVFRDRHHRLLRPASKIPQGSFADGNIPEGGGANIIPAADSGFETALTGNWIIWANVTAPLLQDAVTFFAGTHSLRINTTAAGNAQIIYNPLLAAFSGQPLTIAAEINSPVATSMNVTVFWQDGSGTGLGSTTIGFGASGTANMAIGWNAYSAVFYPPANCAKGQVWVTVAATAAQAFYLDSVTVTPVPSVRMSAPFTYDLGWAGIINTLQIPVPERNPAGAPQIVWQDNAAAAYAIPASGTLVLTVQAGDPFTGAIVPAAGTDFTQLSGTATATLNRTSGQAVTITLTDSGTGSVVTGLQLRAYPVPVTQTQQVAASDATSVTANGIRSLPASSQPVWAGVNDAAAVARMVLNQRAKRLPVVQVTLDGGGDTSVLAQQLARDLSDRVTVTEFETATAGDFFVEQISHTVSDGGARLVTVFGCEKAPATTQPLILDDPLWGLLDTGGVLGI